MRLAIIPILYSVFAAAAIVKRDCSHDNCLRALIAQSRKGAADCSSYFLTTVTPATITATATATVTVFTTSTTFTHGMKVRAPEPTIAVRVVSSSIPAYASACSGSVRYSSACSCIGVTGATTTGLSASKTVTVTTTTTNTASVTDAFVPASLTFNLNTYDAACTGPENQITITNGQCFFPGDAFSYNIISFSPGSCPAMDCEIANYISDNCSGAVYSTGDLTSTQCIIVNSYVSFQLLCSGNGCS